MPGTGSVVVFTTEPRSLCFLVLKALAGWPMRTGRSWLLRVYQPAPCRAVLRRFGPWYARRRIGPAT